MPPPIEFYFDFSSPYGYLGAQRIDAIAGGREVVWKPFLLGVVFRTTGAAPLLHIPVKGDYSHRDMARCARRLGVPFRLPETFPFLSVAACRAFYWLSGRDPAAGKALARALFRKAFGEGGSIAEPAAVAAAAAELGHDRATVLAALRDPGVKDRLKREVGAAIEKGVFGSPFVIVDGEPFWGQDRLEDAGRWARTGGW